MELLDYKQAAKYLRMGVRSLSRLVTGKMITHIRLTSKKILFKKEDLDMWIDKHTVRSESIKFNISRKRDKPFRE